MSSSTSGRFLPILGHVTDGCTVIDVDPSACIPLHLSRARSDNAIMRLMNIFNGSANEHQSDFGLTGMVSGAPTSVVVPLIGNLAYLLDEYLALQHENPEAVEHQKAKHTDWFGIIDGCQFRGALMELGSEEPSK